MSNVKFIPPTSPTPPPPPLAPSRRDPRALALELAVRTYTSTPHDDDRNAGDAVLTLAARYHQFLTRKDDDQ